MKIRFLTTCFLTVSLFLTSCSSVTPGFSAETPDELKTMRQARLTYGVGGALLGAGAAYLLSHNKSSEERRRNTIAGGLAGAVGGTLFGQKQGAKTVGKKRSAKASEAYLRQQISKSRKFNSALASYNRRLTREIAQLRRTKNKRQLSRSRSQSRTALSQAKSQLKNTRRFNSDPANSNGRSRMKSNEVALKAHISRLEQRRKDLDNISGLSKAS